MGGVCNGGGMVGERNMPIGTLHPPLLCFPSPQNRNMETVRVVYNKFEWGREEK